MYHVVYIARALPDHELTPLSLITEIGMKEFDMKDLAGLVENEYDELRVTPRK